LSEHRLTVPAFATTPAIPDAHNLRSLGTLDDLRGAAEGLAALVKVGRWGSGGYRVEIISQIDLDYRVTLVKQSREMSR